MYPQGGRHANRSGSSGTTVSERLADERDNRAHGQDDCAKCGCSVLWAFASEVARSGP